MKINQDASFKFNANKVIIFMLVISSLNAKADLVVTETRGDQTIQSTIITNLEDSLENNDVHQESDVTSEVKSETNQETSTQDASSDNSSGTSPDLTTRQTDIKLSESLEETNTNEENTNQESTKEENTTEISAQDNQDPITQTLETKKLISYKDSYDFEHTPSVTAKIFQVTLLKDNQTVLNKFYYAQEKTFALNIKLSKGYGDYTLIYSEYDGINVFKKKTLEQKYEISYKKTAFNYKPKVSSSVQANHPEIIDLAAQITQNIESEFEKMMAINGWITQHVVYNYSPTSYSQKNDALTTLNKKTGICMGYANLFAAIARAAGLETKVMTGKGKTGGKTYYHQWNEVKINNEWYFIDTTWNAGLKNKETFISKASQYPASHTKAKEVRAL